MSTVNCSKQQNDQFENLYISSHREARNIKFGHQINIIKRVPLGTSPQAVVMSLAQNHLTNLYISNYRGAAVIKFKQLCDRTRQGTSPLGVVTSLSFHHVFITWHDNFLYLQLQRGHRGYVHPCKRSSSTSCFKYFLIIKICRKDKCSCGS